MTKVPTEPFSAVVLAAGKSTRMKSKRPKALHPVAGQPLLKHVLDALIEAGAQQIVVVVGHQAEAVKSTFGDDFEYVLQAEQLGTGHAVRMAETLLAGTELPIVVVPGDAPLITSEAVVSLLSAHKNNDVTLLSVELDDPTGYGRIVRGADGTIHGIVEQKDADAEQLKIREVGVSIYAFRPAFLFNALSELSPANSQNEYYLTDTIAIARSQGKKLGCFVCNDPDVGLGVNNRVELSVVSKKMNARIIRSHQLGGVTVVDPDSTYIDKGVKIGVDTIILPSSIVSGITDIGEDCIIGPGVRISDSQIGDRVHIRDSYVVSSEVGTETTVGPFANLRPGSIVGKNVKIGDFVELKKATLEDAVSAGHFTYLGDVTVGSGTNIGAGTITCNYDGEKKHQTVIGANSFIGSNSTLVAPVTIGESAYIAAGSVITNTVEPGSLALGRARQVNKPKWADQRKTEKSEKRA
jgi:bifunctional UDP-N-acetylglucosamine pyrophosphorylase/glucosamine-1-phosphate N-acetyltransferase